MVAGFIALVAVMDVTFCWQGDTGLHPVMGYLLAAYVLLAALCLCSMVHWGGVRPAAATAVFAAVSTYPLVQDKVSFGGYACQWNSAIMFYTATWVVLVSSCCLACVRHAGVTRPRPQWCTGPDGTTTYHRMEVGEGTITGKGVDTAGRGVPTGAHTPLSQTLLAHTGYVAVQGVPSGAPAPYGTYAPGFRYA